MPSTCRRALRWRGVVFGNLEARFDILRSVHKEPDARVAMEGFGRRAFPIVLGFGPIAAFLRGGEGQEFEGKFAAKIERLPRGDQTGQRRDLLQKRLNERGACRVVGVAGGQKMFEIIEDEERGAGGQKFHDLFHRLGDGVARQVQRIANRDGDLLRRGDFGERREPDVSFERAEEPVRCFDGEACFCRCRRFP